MLVVLQVLYDCRLCTQAVLLMLDREGEDFKNSHFDCVVLQSSLALCNEVRRSSIQTVELVSICSMDRLPDKCIFLGSKGPDFGEFQFEDLAHDIERGLKLWNVVPVDGLVFRSGSQFSL